MAWFSRTPPQGGRTAQKDPFLNASSPREIAAAFHSTSGARTLGAMVNGMLGRQSTHSKVQLALQRAADPRFADQHQHQLTQAKAHATEWLAKRKGRKGQDTSPRAQAMRATIATIDKFKGRSDHMVSAGSNSVLGSGNVNTVYKSHFIGGGKEYVPSTKPDGGVTHIQREKPWVYKPDDVKADVLRAEISHNMSILGVEQRHLEHTGFADRNILVSDVAKTLGTSVIPETRLATHQGRRGMAMEVAPGHAPQYDEQVQKTSLKELRADWSDSDIKTMGYHINAEGTQAWKTQTKFYTHDYGLKKGSSTGGRTQRDAMDLQAVDFLTNAGADRHAGNFHYDHKTGGIKGIDNDFAFGTNHVEPSSNAGKANHSVGLPPMIHASTAAHIEGLGKKALDETLGRLHPEERAAALERHKTLQTHVKELREKGNVMGGISIKHDPKWDKLNVKERAAAFHFKRDFSHASYHELLKDHEAGTPNNYLKRLHDDSRNYQGERLSVAISRAKKVK